MSENGQPEALAAHNAWVSKSKQRAAWRALAELVADPLQPISISAVARRAKVTREFINTHDKLHKQILQERDARRLESTGSHPRTDDSTLLSMRAQRDAFALRIEMQKSEAKQFRERITELERQREIALGIQVGERLIDPTLHDELQLDHDNLAVRCGELERDGKQKDRTIRRLQEELIAARKALQETVAADEAPLVVLKPTTSAERSRVTDLTGR